MRPFLLLLALSCAGVLAAQTKTDTIWNRNGTLNQLRYFSVRSVETLTRAEQFQRGIAPGQAATILQLDSIRIFDEAGGSKVLKEPGQLGGPSALPAARGYRNEVAAAAKKREQANASSTATDYVEGRAGMLVRRPIPQPADGKSVKDIKRLDDSPEIELIENVEGGNGEIIAKVRIPAGTTRRKLRLDFGNNRSWEKLYTIRGYHLNETDFKRRNELTDEQTWRAEGRDYLYLRLRSTEKLMHIYLGEEQFKPLPVGRQLDEVYVGGLKVGKYLLEIIDLGSGEKRYYWVVVA